MQITSNVGTIIQQLTDYKTKILRQAELFLTELASVGVQVANSRVAIARATPVATPTKASRDKGRGQDKYLEVNDAMASPIQVSKSATGAHYRVKINLTGKDVLFVEFSAGITSGTSPGAFPLLPTGTPYGARYGVGTYPGQQYAEDPEGWFFQGDDGAAYHSYGNEAYAPMYHAEDTMCRVIRMVAARVFV